MENELKEMEEAAEKWLPIKRYPGYLISNLGRVKSTKRTFISGNGKKYTITEKILTIRKDRAGNDQVVIWNGDKMNYELIEVLWFQSKKEENLKFLKQ